MTLELPFSLKSSLLLLGILGAAIGLNLSVMGIGATSASTEQAVTSTVPPADPEVRQVVVDVPVPTNGTEAQAAAVPVQASAVPAPAVLAPTAPAPATPAPAATPATASPIAAPTPTPAPTPAPAAAAPKTTAAPATTAPTAPSTSASPTTAATTEYLSYTFEGVAEIVVAYHNGQALEFWSATTESGWAYMVENDTANRIELKFRRVSGGEGEAKFELIRKDGQLEVKKER